MVKLGAGLYGAILSNLLSEMMNILHEPFAVKIAERRDSERPIIFQLGFITYFKQGSYVTIFLVPQ